MAAPEIQKQFILASTWHGRLEEADRLLRDYPDLAVSSIHIAAILADTDSVKQFLASNPDSVKLNEHAYGANPLTMLCFSKYLSCKKIDEDKFVECAQLLIAAGADVNIGFQWNGQFPDYETPLYGAAGVAHNAKLTTLLLKHGADPNDVEAVYHSPETYQNDAMKALVETGKVKPEHLALMLIRKHDFHDYDGAKWLLEYGVDANVKWNNNYPLHHALKRCNSIDMIKLLFDHGAEASVMQDELSGVARAAREGRADVLLFFRERGIDTRLHGIDELLAACALGDEIKVRSLLRNNRISHELMQTKNTVLAKFAGNGNAVGVALLVNSGIDVNTPYTNGDGYFEIPKNSLPIHIACWRAKHEVVKFLIRAGANIHTPDANNRTPLALAIKACVNSYWTELRKPDSVKALLEAGAEASKVVYPTGYAEIDSLIAEYRQ